MGASQQFSLRWNNYLRHITCAFDSQRNDDNLVDVTLSCEGKKIRAHKMLLSACSTYFQDLFKENPCQHPVVIFRNVKFEDLSALVDFMYQGEVNVTQDQLSSFLATAELLAIQGLSDGNGSDVNLEQKETEMPDSPLPATEPEVQLSNNGKTQKSLRASGRSSEVSSPVSFLPLDQSCDSPPSNKRRKWGNSAGGSGTTGCSGLSVIDKDSGSSEREKRRTPLSSKPIASASQESVEIIPIMPNLKLELPDYDDEDPDGSSCSYGDSNQDAGPGGTFSAMSQLLSHSHGNTSTPNAKQEAIEMYNTNSRDESQQHSTEVLSASDISQILAKPGTSGENQSQDSLQGDGGSTFGSLWMSTQPSPQDNMEYQDGFYLCKVCGKSFRRQNSLYDHMAYHQGTSKCTICNCIYSRKGNMKRHMRDVHGIMD